MSAAKKLKSVGYWKPSYTQMAVKPEDSFPDPRLLTQCEWRPLDRQLVLGYLRSGRTFAQWRGLSYCRFHCGVSDSQMGSRCLTDGIWVWPEGLPHYIEHHQVYLPTEFVRTMRRRGWKIPEQKNRPATETDRDVDDSF